MELFYFIICFLLLFVAQNNGDEMQRNYITWNDLTVNKGKSDTITAAENRIIVVDRNGGGDSLTVQGAVDTVPQNNAVRVKIRILPGEYREKVLVPATKPYISFIGDPNQPSSTVITWHDKASDKDNNGGMVGTWNSASVTVEADYFCASGITFQNSVAAVFGAEGYQAVALRISGDKSMFYKSNILGSQDTLLDEIGAHYFYQCLIQGSIDFIFGNARSLYQECTVSVVGYLYAVTAQGRNSANEDTGFSFVHCTVRGTGDGGVFLGRAWGDYSRVVYSYCEFDINVRTEGWDDWGIPSRQKTAVFGEYECSGVGANRSGRAGWSKALNDHEAKPFLDTKFISGELWLKL